MLHSQVTHSDVCSIKLHHPHTHREDPAHVCVFSLALLSFWLSAPSRLPTKPVSDNISDFLLGLLADNPGSFLCSLTCSEVTLVEPSWAIWALGKWKKEAPGFSSKQNPFMSTCLGCTLITPVPRWPNLCLPSWSGNTGQEDELVMTQAQNRWWLPVSMLLRSYKGETLSVCL